MASSRARWAVSAAWALCALMVLCAPVMGQNCDQPKSVAESGECAQLRLRAAEREMLEQMRVIEALEDDNLKRAVAAAQDAWRKWREAEGDAMAAATSDAELSRLNRDTLKAQLTEDRVRDLRAYSGQ